MAMASRSFLGLGPHGFHRVAYSEWGDPANPRVLVCVHGLTCNGRDFDDLAEALSDRWRVLCPDVVGRGRSDRLAVKEDYGFPQYCADMSALIARSGAEQVDWLGTSMGGIIGMMLASQPQSPIHRMVLNDVGAVVAAEGLRRIAGYVGTDPLFPDFEAAYRASREVNKPFGPMTEAQWRRFTENALRRQQDGGYRLDYDPNIAWSMKQADPQAIELWALWDRIRCPVLVLRGSESDLLRAGTAAEMRGRGPGCELIEVPGIGHCPALMDEMQIEAVRSFLNA
jgi:pimeloyl-ACP methyl ester carboxylesterase